MSSKTLRRVLGILTVFTAVFAVLSVKTQAATNEDVKPIVYDAEYYITTAKDLQDAYIREDGSVDEEGLYGQFVVYGIAEGRKGSPSFDIKYYMEANPDLAKEFGATNYARGYQHFLEYGLYEGRTGCNLYDNACYKANNPDLVTAYGNANEMYYVHFVLFGQGEARKACDWFDIKCYVNSNADLKKEFGTNWKAGYKHYAFFGNSENRIVAHTWENGVCTTCGETATVTGHTHNYVVSEAESIPATCTTTGRKVEYCSVCEERRETVVPALGHDYSVEATEAQLAAKGLHRATCEDAGVTATACSHCGALDMETIQSEPAIGHDWVNFREVKQEDIKADKELEGKKYVKECSRCDVKLGMTVIEAFEDPSIAELEVDNTTNVFGNVEKLTVPAGTKRTVVNGQLKLKTPSGSDKTELNIDGDLYVDTSLNTNNQKLEINKNGTVTMLVDTEEELKAAMNKTYIDTVELTANITATSNEIELNTNTDKTIDLKGFTITSATGRTAVKVVYRKDVTLTIKGGKISSDTRAIQAEGNLVLEDCELVGKNTIGTDGEGLVAFGPSKTNAVVKDSIKVVLNNVKIDSAKYSVATNGSDDNVDVELNNVTAYSSANKTCLFFPAKGNVIINGGSFTGGTALEVVSANLDIKGGAKLSATETKYENGNQVVSGSTGNGSVMIITSRGGNYTSDNDTVVVKIAADVTFSKVNPQAHNVEFIENQKNPNGASFDITWEGKAWTDVYKDMPSPSTIKSVTFNGELVAGNSVVNGN